MLGENARPRSQRKNNINWGGVGEEGAIKLEGGRWFLAAAQPFFETLVDTGVFQSWMTGGRGAPGFETLAFRRCWFVVVS